MKISEIFYSLQGEGNRAGTPSIFIRTSGCKAKFACAQMGIKCDTEFESGTTMDDQQIYDYIKKWPCKEIVWTGGEPTDQLTTETINFFKKHGYYQCIETSGLNPVPDGIDYICISPKVAEHILAKNFKKQVDELRYVRHSGQSIPAPSLEAKYYYISPHSDGNLINEVNLKHCTNLCIENPQWRLSVQLHKIFNIL